MDGLLVIDKPMGWSSMDVVRRVRRAAGEGSALTTQHPQLTSSSKHHNETQPFNINPFAGGKKKLVKCGHAGTLDPLATGIVICCLGKATSLVEELMGLTKVYETEIDLSAFTATDDREGIREEVAVSSPPCEEKIKEALKKFIGTIEQRPPAYSAVHVGGKRAYQLARAGKKVETTVKKIRIDEIELLSYLWPMLTLKITCGRGTYIRSIARDLGMALGTGGHLAGLRRTRVGPFRVEDAAKENRLNQPITQADLLAWPVKNNP